MPLVLLAALAGSLAIHMAVLFGTDVELLGESAETPPLEVEIKAPPPAPPESAALEQAPRRHPVKRSAKTRPQLPAVPPVLALANQPTLDELLPTPADLPEILPSTAAMAPPPAAPPAGGAIRFAIFKDSLNLQVGRAEQRWEFLPDGRYRLTGITETSGLVAVFKPVRMENESVGRLVAGGLQPDTFRTRKNGRDTGENADFDWSTAAVHLTRDNSTRRIAMGTQDLLSLNYQLAYLKAPEEGGAIGVVTGKKYERYDLDALGEETLDTPAGHFRTLHLRAMTDSVTEIWIALDQHRLPVKIRFTDRKGDSYTQIATEIDLSSPVPSTTTQPPEGAPASPQATRQEATP